MADAPAVPRRRRWRRRLAIGLFAVLVLIFFAPVIAARCGLVQSLAAKALADYDATATIGSASLGWFSPVELENVTLADSKGRTLLSVPKVITSKTLFGFLTDSANLGTVTLERPAVEIVCENETTNLEASLTKLLTAPSTGKSPSLMIEASGGSVKIIDAAKEWSFTDVGIVADVGDTTRLRLKVPRQLTCDVTLAPQLQATIDAESFPIEAAGPFLRRFEPGLALTGTLSGQAVTSGDRIEGDLRIDSFTAASPRLAGERLALDTIRLPFKLKAQGTVVDVEAAKLTCPVAEATFVGRIDTSAPHALINQPGVTASASVDIARLAKMLPKYLQLKPGTELTEGKVEVHLASQAVGQWSGQFKASALKGQRDGQPLAWDQPVIATFAGRIDDKYRPDFEKLSVVANFARIDAAGTLDRFKADADVSLDDLAVQLAKFVDLSGIRLAGKAYVQAAPGSGSEHVVSVRLANLAASAAEWQFAGDGSLATRVSVKDNVVTLSGLQGDLKTVRFKGLGVDLDEPAVKVIDSQLQHNITTGQTAIARLQLSTQTIAIGATSDPAANASSRPIEASINADLARLQKMLLIPGEPIAGMLRAKITATFDGSQQSGTVTGKIANFRYGPPTDPIWAEPNVDVSAEVKHAGGTITIAQSAIGGLQGLGFTAKGTLQKSTLDITGDFAYELDKLQPRLRAMLGASFTASGYGTRPFHLKGGLDDPTLLVGDASVAWKSLAAYGFDVGASQIDAKVAGGTLTTTPISANFGSTGKVKLEPTLRFLPGTNDLTFQKGRVIERATLTPAACAEAIGFALPAIAKSSKAEGTISFDLEDHRVLLNDINGSTLRGKLTLHDVTVTAGPVIAQVAQLFGEQNAKLILAKDQAVNIRIEKGRVHHENLKLSSHGFTVSTSGSVGFDGSLSLVATMPMPETVLGPALKNVPKIRDALAKQTLTIPIAGTLSKPAVDKKVFDAAVAAFVREVTKEAAAGKLEELFKKGLEKAVPKKP